jgi:hypothetical protein
MARVVYGAEITELIGSIGGMTFQRNSSGTIARLKPNSPVNPSPIQGIQQNSLAQLVALWPTLTPLQKASWDALAAAHDHINPWSETKTLNGYQWFLSCNLYCTLAGDAIQVTAPAYAPPAPPSAFTLTASAFNLSCEFGVAYTAVPDHLFIYLSLPIRANSLKLRRSFYLVSVDDAFNNASLILTALFESLANVTWADFFNSSNSNIICRLLRVKADTGMNSAFTSSLVNI